MENEKKPMSTDAAMSAVSATAAASTYSDLLVRIMELTNALIAKGVISTDDLKNSMTTEERNALFDAAAEEFVKQFGQIGRLMVRTD